MALRLFTAQFIKPDFLDRNQSLQVDAGAVRQNLLAYYQNAVSADVLLKRTFFTHWSGSIGISGEAERIAQEGITRNYTLVGLPIAVKYDNTNSLLEPIYPSPGSSRQPLRRRSIFMPAGRSIWRCSPRC